MRWLPLSVFIGILAGCSQRPAGDPAHGHDHGQHHHHGEKPKATLQVRSEPGQPVAGKPATLKLTVFGADGTAVKDFEPVHGEKAHLIVVRNGLDVFAHLHPRPDPDGVLTAEYVFPTGGVYQLFVDHRPRGGKDATARAVVAVEGEAAVAPPLKQSVPGTVRADGLQARVTVEAEKGGGDVAVRFELLDDAGNPVADLQPYRGAGGHLILLTADGGEYAHARPAEGVKGPANAVAFQAHLHRTGLYKGWGEFERGGEVRVVPIVLRIE